MNKKVFVAYLDVMGFADFVTNNGCDAVINVINNIISLTAQISIANVSAYSNTGCLNNASQKLPYKTRTNKDGKQESIPDLDQAKINSLIMFDSILFWTNSDTEEDFHQLCYTIAWFLKSQLVVRFPVRGAISFGDFYYTGKSIPSSSVIHHFTLVSSAQVLAQRLESKQLWSGCVLHDSAVEQCKKLGISFDSLAHAKIIIQYPVPLKGKDFDPIRQNMYALVWQGQMEEFIPERRLVNIHTFITDSFLGHGKKITSKEQLLIDNTAEFVNYVFPISDAIKYVSEPLTETRIFHEVLE